MIEFDRTLGARATQWRKRSALDTDPAWVAVKLCEEVGEVARALVGEHEFRPGRGNVVQEAAQTVIVLASLVNITHPDADLFAAVRAEMERLGA